MKGNKLKTKIIGIIIAFIIAVFLSAIISTILHLIFTKTKKELQKMFKIFQHLQALLIQAMFIK